MSIVKLQRVTLCGMVKEKEAVLDQLQYLGCLHLNSLRTSEADGDAASDRPEIAYRALRHLGDTPDKRLQIRSDPDFNMHAVVEKAEENRLALIAAQRRQEELETHIRLQIPWGDFTPPSPDELGGYKFWYYQVPNYQLSRIAADLIHQVVQRDDRFAYVVVISQNEPAPGLVPVPRSLVGHRSLSSLYHLLERNSQHIEELNFERLSLTRWIFLITQHLARAEDHSALRYAASTSWDEGSLFAVQGWIAEYRLNEIRLFAERYSLALLIEEPEIGDHPPTLLNNPAMLSGGEDMTRFFQTPDYRDWDPSRVLFFSFALFFAMIMSDAGYALVLGLALFAGWRRFGRSQSGRRLRNLSAVTLSMALGYGVLAGSYFGVSPADDSVLASLNCLDMHDFDMMITLSVLIGVLHLMLANGMKAAYHWGHHSAWVAVGWNSFLLGAAMLWLVKAGVLSVTLIDASWICITAGMLLVTFYAGNRPVHNVRDALSRLLSGIHALTHATRAFGDVLSYLRLFALGLASSSLALTFNQLSSDVMQAMPGVGILLGLLILLLGHALNLALAVMSGVVHGLRLNFIEFYNWGLSDEGYPFRAFEKKELLHE
ncbi:MAG: V-type ATP synthase subunit I [Burkholderiales bacterium]|nr:V-type ATP synthase subunit I [Burkholderiales bacterium]